MFSVSPGFVGEAYANGGLVFVVILSLLFGMFVSYYDRHFMFYGLKISSLPYFGFLPFFFLVFRGDFYSSITYPLYIFFGMLITLKISRIL